MSDPTITCEIGFNADPTQAPVWTDVTAYLQAFTVRRGRQHELGRIETGTATATLDNDDRRFDPTHTAGPYYPNVLPLRRIRLSATWEGTTYRLFTGYVEDWPIRYPGPTTSDVEISASDGMLVLSNHELNGAFAQQRSDQRIAAVLDSANYVTASGWQLGYSQLGTTTTLAPVGVRSLSAGLTTVQAATLAGVNALRHVQDVADAENGLFLFDGDGTARFLNRREYLAPPQVIPGAWGDRPDAAGEIPYVDITPIYGQDWIYNDIRITRTGGTEQVASDAASRGRYFKRTLSKTGLPMLADADALALANWLLGRYKAPALRFGALRLGTEPINGLPLWPLILVQEIGNRMTVRRRPPGGGALIEQPSRIEGIDLRWEAASNAWDASWSLSPVEQTTGWVLGASRLGLDTALAY